jgi:uncharacterized protein (TIGR00730 family)
MKRICVFCGAALGADPLYAEEAQKLGRMLAHEGLELVFGGGRVGLMGKIANAALAAGGKVIGVIPKSLRDIELDHRGLTEIHIVASMHERKALMEKLSDGFIAMPGGIGTLDEFFEIWTWAQLGIHRKPYGILNVKGYFDPLISFFDEKMVPEEFVEKRSRAAVMVETDPAVLLKRMRDFKAPDIRRALKPEEG